ncbi:ABI family [Artemisia annua]|uniref:ABI family n=1 Tax=Artemisia annua TaxID=35608 RepID=A0A2U1KK95_ARTAN|nr:ABI family [Artemisia annua]
MEDGSDSYQTEYSQTEPQHFSKFTTSIQELKDLCSQLHAAAGYCETTFLNSKQKHLVVENTKEYVCRAVVAVVDHLGSVSANLDHHISETNTNTISQTEVKIDSMKQRFSICQEYSDKLARPRLTWNVTTPRYNSRYLKPPASDVLSRNKSIRDSGSEIDENNININQGFKFDEEVPLFFYTCIYKTPSSDFGDMASVKSDKTRDSSSSLSALAVRDNLSIQSKPQSLSFQLQDKRKSKRGTLFRKSLTSNEILSIIRRRK